MRQVRTIVVRVCHLVDINRRHTVLWYNHRAVLLRLRQLLRGQSIIVMQQAAGSLLHGYNLLLLRVAEDLLAISGHGSLVRVASVKARCKQLLLSVEVLLLLHQG